MQRPSELAFGSSDAQLRRLALTNAALAQD
jgi:hypothetical protein